MKIDPAQTMKQMMSYYCSNSAHLCNLISSKMLP
jgi:hypothetical protein